MITKSAAVKVQCVKLGENSTVVLATVHAEV